MTLPGMAFAGCLAVMLLGGCGMQRPNTPNESLKADGLSQTSANTVDCPDFSPDMATYLKNENVEKWKSKIISLIGQDHGFITRDVLERTLCLKLVAVEESDPGHRQWIYESKVPNELSISLDEYSRDYRMPYWQKVEGEWTPPHSILNIAGMRIGCYPLQQMDSVMNDMKLVKEGSIAFHPLNMSRSISEYADTNYATRITTYYDVGSPFAAPCVYAVRILGYHWHLSARPA